MTQTNLDNGTARGRRWVTRSGWLAVLFAGVACLRLYYCFQLPVNTGDIPRHLFYGLYTAKMGLAAAGHRLVELNPSLQGVSWSALPYNYPIVTLLFFTAVAKLWPSIFFVKFSLTALEALNAALIYQFTRQRWLAWLYWASPVSVWWVSHEGQFEPLQILFTAGALVALKDRQCLAAVLLALAIQVKLTAIFFVPYVALGVWRANPKGWPRVLASFVLGFTPTCLAAFYYPVLAQILFTAKAQGYNPYYWNFFQHRMFGWNPGWLVILDQCSSYGMLAALGALAIRRRRLPDYFAPICFVLFCKASPLCQFWYFALFVPFLLSLPDRRERLWLAALAPLLDTYSLGEMIRGPFGFTLPHYYDGVSVFMRHAI